MCDAGVSDDVRFSIQHVDDEPCFCLPYLNAGRGAGGFYVDSLPVHLGQATCLPDELDALVVTADLQGRETLESAAGGPPRLLGEVVPDWLCNEVFPEIGLSDPKRVAAVLCGDFYTVPALDRRGGSGDVDDVWREFEYSFGGVVGVAGNHDTFGGSFDARPRFGSTTAYLDFERTDWFGLRVGGLGGMIGNSSKPRRRNQYDYVSHVTTLLQQPLDLLVLHDGPAGNRPRQKGCVELRELMLQSRPCTVLRGHAHWGEPLATLENGTQILNVDARVVVLTRMPQ